MRAEDTLQYMADFVPELFPTRKHALNDLFCVIGNGYKWIEGELVDDDSKYTRRYRLINPIQRAEFENEKLWYENEKFYKELYEDEEKKIPMKYRFEWYPISREFSYLFNYPENIKPDWLGLLNECKQMLIEDGIIID